MKNLIATFESAIPVLPSLDLARTAHFYSGILGFDVLHNADGYLVLRRDMVGIHFWLTDNKDLPASSVCRVRVSEIEELHAHCEQSGIVHPNGTLSDKPWGTREFAIIDPDSNLLTFNTLLPLRGI